MHLISKWKFCTKIHYFCIQFKKNWGGAKLPRRTPHCTFLPSYLFQNFGSATI